MYPDPAPTSATVEPFWMRIASSARSGCFLDVALLAIEPGRALIAHHPGVPSPADRMNARRLRENRNGRDDDGRKRGSCFGAHDFHRRP